MQVELKNYKSFRNAKLTFQPGLTLLIGDNSVGKTAILQSVYDAIYNGISQSAIHAGTSQSGIEIKIDENKLVLSRNRSTQALDIFVEGVQSHFEKWGRTYPSIYTKFKFPEKSKSLLFNFYFQSSPLIPFNSDFYTSLFGDIRHIREKVNSYRRGIFQKIKLLEKQKQELQSSIEMSQKLLSYYEEYEKIDSLKKVLQKVLAYFRWKSFLNELKEEVAQTQILSIEDIFGFLIKTEELKRAKANLYKAKNDLDSFVKSLDKCPFCGAPISQSDILHSGFKKYMREGKDA